MAGVMGGLCEADTCEGEATCSLWPLLKQIMIETPTHPPTQSHPPTHPHALGLMQQQLCPARGGTDCNIKPLSPPPPSPTPSRAHARTHTHTPSR